MALNRPDITTAMMQQAVLEHGSITKAAAALNVNERSIRRRFKKVGASRVPFAAPADFTIRGVSTLYDAEGNVRQEWVKSWKTEQDLLAQLLRAVADSCAPLERVPTIEARGKANTDLMTVYPMGDPHIGMYAWAEETGANFNLELAEANLVAATRRLVNSSPPSATALIVNLGDFFHADNKENRTMRSGHVLDVDTRYAKVLRIGLRAMRACIEAALRKHQAVEVINEIGNHDENTSQAMTLALAMLYEKNPRVTFDESPAKFHYRRFHKVLIGVTHGDTVKPEQLGGIMATDRPEDWGATLHRMWLTGHVHHRRVFELPGCTVESLRTLAGPDAWTAASGYRSGRDMQGIVLHRDYGEVERHRVDICQLVK